MREKGEYWSKEDNRCLIGVRQRGCEGICQSGSTGEVGASEMRWDIVIDRRAWRSFPAG